MISEENITMANTYERIKSIKNENLKINIKQIKPDKKMLLKESFIMTDKTRQHNKPI